MRGWKFVGVVFVSLMCFALAGCDASQPTSDQKQSQLQEQALKSIKDQVGMPVIKNGREARLAKTAIEARDREDLVLYAYIENMIPTVVPGHTCLGGKFSYIGQIIGYPLPYATQFTSPQKVEWSQSHAGANWYRDIMPQADPNGLFPPASAEATWVMMADSKGEPHLQYMEARVEAFTFKWPFD